MRLATVACPTLADTVDETLAAALADRCEPCLWCGGPAVTVVRADIWSGEVTVRCPECGSELSGVVPHHLREMRR
ncbi:MAG: hypothetical protein ACXWZZ_13035 [Solirubrobacteraceae bacterium]